jgi:outer membrane protein OmpA-like peptidoglycan-associated protein
MSRYRMIVLSATLVALALTTTGFAQNFADPWLRMGVGAKAMAMGGAQTAVAQDATAAYWNPAALVGLRKFEASLMYTAGMKAERNYNYVSAAMCLDRIGSFSLSWLNAGITGIPFRTTNTADPERLFDVASNAFQLSYARKLGDIAFGLSAKYLQEDLADNDGYGIDAGLHIPLYDEFFVGGMFRDLDGKHGKDRLPYEWRVGVGVLPWKSVTLTSDFVKVKDTEATASIGGAFTFDVSPHSSFYLATGMNDMLRESRGFTAGLGFNFTNWAIQYAYVTEPQEFLDQNHRLSINFFFQDRCWPLRSIFGSIKREMKPAPPHEPCPPPGPKEFIHRYIFEGSPSMKLSLEILRPTQKDSIQRVWQEPGGVVSFPGVNFATGSAEITDDFARVLDGVAQLINEHPEIQLLEIQGHTDNTGTDAINVPLSQERAEAVRNYLVSRGVAPARLEAKGYASTQPVASNATVQGRYQNRRVDLLRKR